MTILSRAGPFISSAVVSRFFLDALSRTACGVRTWREERHHAFAATRRYAKLRTGRETDLPLRDRGSQARQIFIEMYANR